jgi:membrane associated rhomboid family serine protease
LETIVPWVGHTPGKQLPWTWFTYAFVHAGIIHLLGNLLFLWLFGSYLEERLGGFKFLLFFLLGSAAGCAGHDLYLKLTANYAAMGIVLGGASGGVSTILGAFLALLPMLRYRFVLFYGFLLYWRKESFTMPAAVCIPLFFILDELIRLRFGASTDVSRAAHVGGFFFGLLVGLVFRYAPKTQRRIRQEQKVKGDEKRKKADSVYESFQKALSEGSGELALSLVRDAEKRGHPLPLTYEDKLRMCGQLVERGEYFVPKKIYRQLLQGDLTDDRRIEVGLRLSRILLTFEKDLETCKDLLRKLYRRYGDHPRVKEIEIVIEEVKETERNLFKRPK